MTDFTDLVMQAKKMQEKMQQTQEALKKIEEIGRASCRERVQISVVAVSLKKKKKKENKKKKKKKKEKKKKNTIN